MYKFNVANSTLDSLKDYTFEGPNLDNFKRGRVIVLQNKKGGKKRVKKFSIEYVKKFQDGFIIKNSNITLVLKRIL